MLRFCTKPLSTAAPLKWNITTKNHSCVLFKEEEGTKWKEPWFFVQGADPQFGLISRYIDKDEIVTWEKEKAQAEALVVKINAMEPPPKFFVICGDLCDAVPLVDPLRIPQEQDFIRIFKKIRSDVPVLCVSGNHDIGDIPTPDTVNAYRSSFGDDYYSFYLGGILFVVINSQYLFDSTQVPELTEEHNNWLTTTLHTSKVKRIVIFQHIPWFLNDPDDVNQYFTLTKKMHAKWLEFFRESGVEAIFCGHLHRCIEGSYKGLPVITSSAVGAQLGNDLSGARIVKVLEDKIEHKYYPTDELPLKNI